MPCKAAMHLTVEPPLTPDGAASQLRSIARLMACMSGADPRNLLIAALGLNPDGTLAAEVLAAAKTSGELYSDISAARARNVKRVATARRAKSEVGHNSEGGTR